MQRRALSISDYIKTRELSVRLVAQKMGVSRQAIDNYGRLFTPTEKTLSRVAKAMTELGAPTTVLDIFKATHAPDGGSGGYDED